MISDLIQTPIDVALKLQQLQSTRNDGKNAMLSSGSPSLIEFTQSSRVEPLVIIDSTIKSEAIVSDVQHTLCSLFSGYYLMAVAQMGVIGDVSVTQRLDKLNPNRDPMREMQRLYNTLESDNDYTLEDWSVSTEDTKVKSSMSTDAIKPADNLAVGKILEVAFTAGDKTYKMPILVRLVTHIATPDIFQGIFAIGSQRNTLSARYHRFRAGELSGISDFILCNDLVKQHKKAMMNDTSGFYAEAVARRRKNATAGALSGVGSLNSASNMVIISSTTAAGIERELGGSLTKPAIRNEVFEATNLMFLVVVDTKWERVVIYHRTIDSATDVKFSDIKSAAKGKGPDITDLLTDYMKKSEPKF